MPRTPLLLRSNSQRRPARDTLLQRARHALEQGNPARARILLAAPLRANPDDPAMLALAGIAHRASGDPLGAVALLERALHLAPDFVPARLALAEALIETNRLPRALAALDALPANARAARPALLARATALGRLGDQAGEVAVLRDLVSLDPADVAPRLRLGHGLRALGQIDEAIRQYRQILDGDPRNGAAWWSLANLKSFEFGESDRTAMRAALADPALDRLDRIRILFALARAEEMAGRFEPSFALYAEANGLRHAASTHDPARLGQWVDTATTLFTRDFFAARPGHGCPSDAPIFIVGMQRSGSTLVEQMLACHPQIEGTAELPHITQIARELRREAKLKGLSFEAHLALLDPTRTHDLGLSYLERAAAHRHSDRPLFLDKMPNNWALLGLIRLILPRARVIDVRRHPMACGFANFRQFYARGLEHSYSLEEWGRYYALYVAHMAHWDAVLPGWRFPLVYERLVDDPARELRLLTDRLGVDYKPAMLDFHKSDRTVRTISAQQVRRPLSRDALDQWRNFEPWLGPLAAALGPVLDQWEGPA